MGQRLVTNGVGYTNTYQAVTDADGSFNSTAMGKGNFYAYAGALYGATPPNTPAQGISLYRFSAGHGGLQCSICRGSTHAKFPTSHRNENLRNQALQGHVGVMAECTASHVAPDGAWMVQGRFVL